MHDKLLDIPELLAHLAIYLRPQDLLSCVQANRRWNSLFIPFLWHTIDDSTPSWDIILRGCADRNTTSPYYLEVDPKRVREADKDKDHAWVRAVFCKYGRFVRVLSIHWPLVLEAFSMAMDRADSGGDGLESLTIAIGISAQGPIEIDPNRCTASTAADPAQVNVSEPIFPEYIAKDDFTPATPRFGTTTKSKEEAFEYGWVLTQHYWHTILSNRGTIKRLVLERTPMVQWDTRSKDVRLRILAQLEGLQELTCQLAGDRETEDVWTVLETFPRIESLTLFGARHFLFPELIPQTAVNTNLRVLSLRMAKVSINEFVTLLCLLPNLSTLKLGYVGRPSTLPSGQDQDLSLPPIANPLVVRSTLKSLHGKLLDYDRSLRHLPNLLSLIDAGDCNKSLVEAILTHCPRIEVFRATKHTWYIDESRRNPQDHTNQFLVGCASLREYHFIERIIWVDELLRRPWACLGLEWLSCRIVGVDRLNDEEEAMVDRVTMRMSKASAGMTNMLTEEETAVVEKFQGYQRQHHGVYDQLAQLTRLKHLDLGYESRYPWTYKEGESYEKDGVEYLFYIGGKTFDTLELSLDSGLDRLGALKDLEMFGFECLNHRIGRNELDWMARSWPKLNLMYGLDKERLMRIEYDQERAALKAYFEELRPDVVHDSLFDDII